MNDITNKLFVCMGLAMVVVCIFGNSCVSAKDAADQKKLRKEVIIKLSLA
jgi:hypothetical protein